MEPLGIIVFSSVMATASLQLIIESVARLSSPQGKKVDFDLQSMIILSAVIFIKFCLWIVCRRFTSSSSILALAQDHRNDVFFNSFSTVFAFMGTIGRCHAPILGLNFVQ
jgi:divalent metal cation (Fe/Co/Zn/Cd) transporter